MASSTARIMEKPGQELLQQQQQALKCPRCESSNTKFCYYNNYSLSQPRHFCKACKRYWTRGGTLRNVPVGGGCRKNKRVKRPNSSNNSSSISDHHHHHHHNYIGASNSSSSSSPPSLLPSAITSNPSSVPPGQIDLSSVTNHTHHLGPLFYGLANNNNQNNISSDHRFSLPFSRFGSASSGYDLIQPQLNNALGLGFSSTGNNIITDNYNQINGFNNNSSLLLSSYSSIFGTPSPSPSSSSPTTIVSLLASKFTNGGTGLKDHILSARGSNGHFPSLTSPFEDLQITGNNGEPGMGFMKHVKSEDGQRRLDWNGGADNCSAQIDQTVEHNIGLSSSSSPDPSSLNYWSNPTAVGGATWHDPASIGSSVPSLI